MRKWLFFTAALAAVGLLSRLPHPARDIADLKPVRAVWLYMEARMLRLETDTGDKGSGRDLREAAADLKARADGEIFLDTAEFLLLDPGVPIDGALFDLLRPDCKVAYASAPPDLKTISEYLNIHPPGVTLAEMRAAAGR